MNSDNTPLFLTDFADPDYTDTFQHTIRDTYGRIGIAEALISSKPGWLRALFALRNTFAAAVGLKTAASHPSAEASIHTWEPGARSGIFQGFNREEQTGLDWETTTRI